MLCYLSWSVASSTDDDDTSTLHASKGVLLYIPTLLDSSAVAVISHSLTDSHLTM